MAERPIPWDDDPWEEAYASPESSGSATSSLSAGKRSRRNQGSSEDSDDSITVRVQSFRAGVPSLVQLGTKWEPVPLSSPLRQEWDTILKPRVLEILEEYQIDLQASHFIYYLTETSAEMTSQPNITTLIRATAKESEQEWIPVVEALRKYYLSANRPEINIELRDERSGERTECYPVESSEAVVPIWNNNVERQMILKLRGRDWLTLSLFRRGKPSGPKPLVVVLTVSKASTHDWVSIREELVRILDFYHLKYVGVEILRGEKVFGTANNYDRMLLTDDTFTKGMSMGRSIGPRGSQNHASTFGGFIRLQNLKGNWHTFGLTCFRSVAPDGCGHPSLKTWQREGITVGDKTNDLEMDSPSLGDAEETAREWRKSIDARRDSTFQEIERRLNDQNDLVAPREKAEFMVKKRHIDTGLQIIKKIETHFGQDDARLGKVYAASGYRQSNSMAVDWALIEVDESRITSNKLPKAGGDLPPKYVISFLAMGENVPGVASIEPDMEVFKIGRSTGFTAGRLGGIESSTLHSWVQDEMGAWVEEVESKTYTIFTNKKFNYEFGTRGDYGSFVLDSYGNFAGLYFGGTTDLRGVGFFTSADDLIMDIKRVTEAKDVRFDV
ncbi:predicted protein [Histoplasma capsulatum G186AR]|uniref:Uncharacterized protein n=2 Tax=Ajellomyces capsulatus TaxID=5037 RepID=C0NA32_AJECG|nr:uncharacterized protein HCBG_01191 [Histoplasma capsulatum G186AR]EEH11736.1 predicted protein [Histoplasma capsulatum G186AR]KAG5302404.1 peptidase family S64 domain-containing protein [Histoplasma capsulatum]QSS72197.1 peptidase family S64 domain-containing protein [Histoplasma capsulatum G186AR]